MKKLLIFMLLCAALSVCALAVQFPDMPDDWSTEALTAAVDNGLITGSDGYILPDDYLTRAEMAAVMVRAFGATEKADISAFTDVDKNQWYYDTMAIAVKMGLFNGDKNLLTPDDHILREEAFAVIFRALSLSDGDEAVLEAFGDKALVSDWAKGAVSALVANGYVKGADGNIEPLNKITRAEFAQLMHNIFKSYIKTPGTYTSDVDGSVIISSDGVTLKNCAVKGDIIISEGVVIGTALDGVDVSGRIIFRGGNTNSIKNTASNNILMPADGTVATHDLYGRMLGGANFDIMTYISRVNPNGYLWENGVVTSLSGAALTYGDIEIPISVARYYLRAFLSQFDGGDPSMWTLAKEQLPVEYAQVAQQIKDTVADVIIQQHIVTELMAKENAVDTQSVMQTALSNIASVRAQYEQYGVDFDELMTSQGISIELLEELEYSTVLASELFEKMYTEDGKFKVDAQELDDYISNNGYMRAQHILVEDEETANEVLAKLSEGADFMELVAEYNTDPGMQQAGEAGYFFSNGQMVPEFENGCKELDAGEISSAVKTDYGYHIIRRIALTDEDIQNIAEALCAEKLNEEVIDRTEQIKADVIISELYEKIEPSNLR